MGHQEKKLERVVPIGTLALRTGVRVETIRYYEQVGLLPPPERTEGNQRRYGPSHQRRLAFIRHARDLGFAVESTRMLLAIADQPEMPCDQVHKAAATHLADIQNRIARLQSLEKELQRIAQVCSGGVHVRDCAIIEALADHGQCQHHQT